MKNIFIHIFFAIYVCNLFGQNTSDTILLPEVLLSETKLYDFKIGINYEIINPTIIGLSSATTLSEQLSNYSNIYIKKHLKALLSKWI